MVSTSESVIAARRRRGQYSQICASQRIRRALAASASVDVTSLLKEAVCPVSSSSASRPSMESSAAWSSSHIRLLTVPSLSIAGPRSCGRADAISRLMRDASLQPFPDVVTPTCSGPELCVDSSVKVQRFGASATLTGIRSRLQRLEMCAAACDELPEVTNTAST